MTRTQRPRTTAQRDRRFRDRLRSENREAHAAITRNIDDVKQDVREVKQDIRMLTQHLLHRDGADRLQGAVDLRIADLGAEPEVVRRQAAVLLVEGFRQPRGWPSLEAAVPSIAAWAT